MTKDGTDGRARQLLGIDFPILQAPMAGAVSEAGGLGSLPCAMLTVDRYGDSAESTD